MKKTLIIIPARSGSKRIKNKNILKINNKPIINWTIQTAKNSNIFERICVSTDSLKISNIVKKMGAKVPFLRPKKYATDKSTDEDVINHFLKYAKKEKIQLHSICYFYPTSILITEKILIKSLVLNASIGIHEFEKKKKQKISISLEIDAEDNIPYVNHKIENFVSYEFIVKDLKKLINKGHIELLETLGENIFEICFNDPRIQKVKVKLEKLEVFSEADSVGIEVQRSKDQFKHSNNQKT